MLFNCSLTAKKLKSFLLEQIQIVRFVCVLLDLGLVGGCHLHFLSSLSPLLHFPHFSIKPNLSSERGRWTCTGFASSPTDRLMLRGLPQKEPHKRSTAHGLCRAPSKSSTELHWCCLFYLRKETLIPLMCTKVRGGEMCGGEMGGPPDSYRSKRQTELPLLCLTAKSHDQAKDSQQVSCESLSRSKKGQRGPKASRTSLLTYQSWYRIHSITFWKYHKQP